jgi:hypothetical protein
MSINCCGYVLRQYTNIRHNVLHKMWADRAGVYTDALYLKCEEDRKETQNVHVYIQLNTDKDCDLVIAQSYGQDDRGSRVRYLAGAGNFSLHHSVQNGAGAHPASYPMGTRGCFPGDKAAGT